MVGLSTNVIVLESDVAAKCGATLNTTTVTYTMFGLPIPQGDFETIINYCALEEFNLVGSDVYGSTDPATGGAMKDYQVKDCVYNIWLSLPGRIPLGWADTATGEQRITPTLNLIQTAIKNAKTERDRAFKMLQTMIGGGALIEMSPPAPNETQPSFF